jgi:hypothetical protein
VKETSTYRRQVVDHDLRVVFFVRAVGNAAAVVSLMMRLTSGGDGAGILGALRWLS